MKTQLPCEIKFNCWYRHHGGLPERHGKRPDHLILKDGRVVKWDDCAVTERLGFEKAISRGGTRAREEGVLVAELKNMGITISTQISRSNDEEDEFESYRLVISSAEALPIRILWDAYSRSGTFGRPTGRYHFNTTVERINGDVRITEDDPKI